MGDGRRGGVGGRWRDRLGGLRGGRCGGRGCGSSDGRIIRGGVEEH